MARLSGLASEHHLEGPGDTPRRRRRGGRKHRHSSSPNASVNGTKRAASQDLEDIVAVKSKKAKRVQADDEDQISQEMEVAVAPQYRSHHRRHSEPLANPIDQEDHTTESTPPPATQPIHGLTPHLNRIGAESQFKNARRARMSMPAQFHITEVDEVERPREVQFAPLTAVLDGRVKRRLRRSHLSEEVNEIEHHKKGDAKLRKAFANVRNQLREMEQKYADLTLELEASRLGNIDLAEDQHEEYQEKLEDELQDAREVINKLRAINAKSRDDSELPSAVDDEDKENMDDYDQMLLVEPEDLNLTAEQMQLEPLPNGYYATHAIESSQVIDSQVTYESLATIPETSQDSILEPSQIEFNESIDRISSQSMQRFENEIASLTTQLSQARGALRIITIKLQNMNIALPGANVNVIITELQRALDHVLDEYKRLRPESPTDMTSSEVLYKMVESMKDMNAELLGKIAIAEKYHKLTHYLRQQNGRLLDLQADTEAERTDLDGLVDELMESNEKRAHENEELDERISTLTQTVDLQDTTIRGHENLINGLRTELAEAGVDKDRLSQSLQGYREELEKMTQTVTRLEEEHATQIFDLADEHTREVNELQAFLTNEAECRVAAEEDAAAKNDLITNLEARVEKMDEEVQQFSVNLDNLSRALDAEETDARALRQRCEDLGNALYDRENDIENQSEIIQDLRRQIVELNDDLTAEQEGREKAEGDVREVNKCIDDLDAHLRDTGMQANELRLKLFEVQLEKEAAIAELNTQAEAKAAEYEEAMDDATHRQDMSEARISKLEANIVRVTQDLVTTEDTLSELTRAHEALQVERNTLVAKLERELEELRNEYATLETTSQNTIDSLEATIKDHVATIGDYVTSVADLYNTITGHENTAVEVEKLHEEAIAERDAVIYNKDATIENLQEENERLLEEKSSLATRVENEALELLNIMGSHDQIKRALDDTIRVQTGTIIQLQADLDKVQQDNDAEIVVKDSEIEQLKIIGSARVETIVSLEAELEDIKIRFREQAEDSQRTIDALIATNKEALARQEQLATEAQKRTRTALESIAEMKVRGIEIKTNGVNLKKVVHGKVTKMSDNVHISKKTRGRRANKPRDSGFVEPLSDAEYEPSASEVESALEA